ncbi:hypothetical protein EDM54_01590 [Brevibacillus borstelensis]|uniref:hypothetical protein n=1 Tax=Brevibacillus borstelensis TaxID=45462 RepID=UPI000F0900DA|nr:hypothetical protein [Brevibacillus borstelensis]MED1881079.1 hypothetical protein [Brevibacillus borstelensis]RNB66391.1 hypothetical protein EDM54_01590 [Brevibacillus borstelensis]GED53526.1 hypothetical protein BBO01nite_27670 [Brevibacillus borstelensis]
MERVLLLLKYLDRLNTMAATPGGVPQIWVKECVNAIRAELGLLRADVVPISRLLASIQEPEVSVKVRQIIEEIIISSLETNGK